MGSGISRTQLGGLGSGLSGAMGRTGLASPGSALPLNFLLDSRAAGDGTAIVAYDAEFSTLLDAPGGSASSDGGAVGSISDLFGNEGPAVQATAGARPTLDIDGINGRPALLFDGGDWLKLASFAGGAQAQPFTAVVVGKLGSIEPGNTDFLTQGSGAAWQLYLRPGSNAFVLYAGSILADTVPPDTSIHLHAGFSSGASSKYYKDGALRITGNAGTNSLNGLTIGATPGGGENLPTGSFVGAAAVFSGDIGADAREFIHQAAVARFGVPA